MLISSQKRNFPTIYLLPLQIALNGTTWHLTKTLWKKWRNFQEKNPKLYIFKISTHTTSYSNYEYPKCHTHFLDAINFHHHLSWTIISRCQTMGIVALSSPFIYQRIDPIKKKNQLYYRATFINVTTNTYAFYTTTYSEWYNMFLFYLIYYQPL